jgi:uncharacterized protein (DUF488 family)
MTPPIATIGYEGATLDAVIDRLRGAGVEVLADVRAVAASRRAGFSKTVLRESLAAAGIDYVHFRDLGTPKAGRDAARKGRVAEMRAIYADQLATPEAETALARLAALCRARRVALLCFEAAAEGCHRRALTERLAPLLGAEIRDL